MRVVKQKHNLRPLLRRKEKKTRSKIKSAKTRLYESGQTETLKEIRKRTEKTASC